MSEAAWACTAETSSGTVTAEMINSLIRFIARKYNGGENHMLAKESFDRYLAREKSGIVAHLTHSIRKRHDLVGHRFHCLETHRLLGFLLDKTSGL